MASHCFDAGRLDYRPPLLNFGLLLCAERLAHERGAALVITRGGWHRLPRAADAICSI
jgi:hypothetical protein